jgi:hypothetical protein
MAGKLKPKGYMKSESNAPYVTKVTPKPKPKPTKATGTPTRAAGTRTVSRGR